MQNKIEESLLLVAKTTSSPDADLFTEDQSHPCVLRVPFVCRMCRQCHKPQ